MKTYQITEKIALDLMGTEENTEYLVWADGSNIDLHDLMYLFGIEEVEKGEATQSQLNLVHLRDDYRIEDVVVSNTYRNLIEL